MTTKAQKDVRLQATSQTFNISQSSVQSISRTGRVDGATADQLKGQAQQGEKESGKQLRGGNVNLSEQIQKAFKVSVQCSLF